MRVTVELGWPSPKLSPNTGVHYMTRHRFKKAAKDTAYWVTKEATSCEKFPHDGGDIPVLITAHPIAGKCRPDDDNLIASLKAFLDGIALGLGVNDKHFRPTLQWGDPVKHGKVVVTLG